MTRLWLLLVAVAIVLLYANSGSRTVNAVALRHDAVHSLMESDVQSILLQQRSDSDSDVDVDIDTVSESAVDSVTELDAELESVQELDVSPTKTTAKPAVTAVKATVKSATTAVKSPVNKGTAVPANLTAEFDHFVSKHEKTYTKKSSVYTIRFGSYTKNRAFIAAHNKAYSEKKHKLPFALRLNRFADQSKESMRRFMGIGKTANKQKSSKKATAKLSAIRRMLVNKAKKAAKKAGSKTRKATGNTPTKTVKKSSGKAKSFMELHAALYADVAVEHLESPVNIDWSKYDHTNWATTKNYKKMSCVAPVQYQGPTGESPNCVGGHARCQQCKFLSRQVASR